jgi:hypothetical protein
MADLPDGIAIDERVVHEFSQVASTERLEAACGALERNGVRAALVADAAEAREMVRTLLPVGSEVFNNRSRTLETIGVAEDIEDSGRYQPLRLRLYQMDREMQAREMRLLAAAPDYVVGSVHALTQDGTMLIASATGSQLGPVGSGAERVILVIGGQKLVADFAAGLRRIHEYCLPLEDWRARHDNGVGSAVNSILVLQRVTSPGRVTAILIPERLGF